VLVVQTTRGNYDTGDHNRKACPAKVLTPAGRVKKLYTLTFIRSAHK
jgi:hypothetical protein